MSDKFIVKPNTSVDLEPTIKKLFYSIWQYGLWSFEVGGTKLDKFLHKNQHTKRKLLNFEFWTNGEPSPS